MKKLLNFVASIPHDKLLHFIAGVLITAVVAVVFPRFAVLGAIVAGLAKEVYDEITYGGWDWKDLLATIMGGAVMGLIILMQ